MGLKEAHDMQNARPTLTAKTTIKTPAKAENDLDLVGAIWENTGKNGTPYFSLKVNEGKTLSSVDKIIIFRNNRKEGEKSPDLHVFVKLPI